MAISAAFGSAIPVIIISLILFAPSEIMLNETGFANSENDNNPIVAEINGQEIRLEEVQEAVNMEASQDQAIDSKVALERMIAKILLLEEANARNIVISMTEVEEEITSMYVKSGLSQEQFEDKLEEIGTTYDKILKMYGEEMMINKMLDDEVSNAGLVVSDEEVKQVFDDNKETIMAQMGNSTLFEDVSSQIKITLLQQKQQDMALDIIEHLKDNATITTYEDLLQ